MGKRYRACPAAEVEETLEPTDPFQRLGAIAEMVVTAAAQLPFAHVEPAEQPGRRAAAVGSGEDHGGILSGFVRIAHGLFEQAAE